jgi:hypothetical protein
MESHDALDVDDEEDLVIASRRLEEDPPWPKS